jgi:hypothetical protein
MMLDEEKKDGHHGVAIGLMPQQTIRWELN